MIDLLAIRESAFEDFDLALSQIRFDAIDFESMQSVTYVGDLSETEKPPYEIFEGIAVIEINGILIKDFPYIGYKWITGYDALEHQLHRAFGDKDVKAIVFKINSPGGMVSGLYQLCEEIEGLQSEHKKPLISIVDGGAYSAAYALAVMGEVVCCKHAGVGSIGVYIHHTEYSNWFEQIGITNNIIKSGKHKAEGNPYEKLSENARNDMQKSVDDARQFFAEHVAKNQNIEISTVLNTEARTFSGIVQTAQAVDLGLIDQVISPKEAFEAVVQHNQA